MSNPKRKAKFESNNVRYQIRKSDLVHESLFFANQIIQYSFHDRKRVVLVRRTLSELGHPRERSSKPLKKFKARGGRGKIYAQWIIKVNVHSYMISYSQGRAEG